MKARVNTSVLGMLISALISCCALGDEPPVAVPPPEEAEVVRALPVGEVITVVRDGRRMTTLRRVGRQALGGTRPGPVALGHWSMATSPTA